ncbi:MAG TPA: hypothetical protein VNH18_33390 [Bryobacteraceae bacterium]|nr:hypothetical protein [Bryobacteraceae bacterium]
MRILFWLGLVVLVMGVASLVVPIPRSEERGFRAGGISVGVETHHSEKVPPVVSAVMILVGAGMLISQRVKA